MPREVAIRVLGNVLENLARNTDVCALRSHPHGPLNMVMLAQVVGSRFVKKLNGAGITLASFQYEGSDAVRFQCRAEFARRHGGGEALDSKLSLDDLRSTIEETLGKIITIPKLDRGQFQTFFRHLDEVCMRLTRRDGGREFHISSSYIWGGGGVSSIGKRPASARLPV